MPDPTSRILFGSVLPKKAWVILCKTVPVPICKTWSSFGRMHFWQYELCVLRLPVVLCAGFCRAGNNVLTALQVRLQRYRTLPSSRASCSRLGAKDTAWGHKAKDITPSMAWRREAWKEEALDDLPSKDQREPSSIRRTFGPFQRQRWRNFWETGWRAYGLFRALKYHLELKWTSGKRRAVAASKRVCVFCVFSDQLDIATVQLQRALFPCIVFRCTLLNPFTALAGNIWERGQLSG